MNTLPTEILFILFEYLPVSDLFASIVLLSKEFFSVIKNAAFMTEIIRIMTGTKCVLGQDQNFLLKILKKGQKRSSKKPLDLVGFGTTGGVDDDLPQYWVDNLFQVNSSSYCSKIPAGLSCVSVLKSTQKSNYTKLQLKYRKIAAKIVRKNPILNKLISSSKRTKESLLPLEESLYLTAWAENPFIINAFALDYSERTRQRVYQELRRSQLNLVQLRKDSENILFKPVDHDFVSEFPVLGLIKGVLISREGEFSCPGNCFWAFASENYVECCINNFHQFETAKNAEDVETLCRSENLFQISEHIKTDHFEYFLFKKSKPHLSPLIWFKFLDDRIDKVEIPLSQIFACKYFYVTFTDVLNQMQEMQDFHPTTNVDFTYIVPYGFEVLTK